MEYDSLSRCLGGEMVDTRDSKSRAKERGGSSPLQGIMLRIPVELEGISSAADHEILAIFSI